MNRFLVILDTNVLLSGLKSKKGRSFLKDPYDDHVLEVAF